MPILTRNEGESLTVQVSNKKITVTLLPKDKKGQLQRIGIDAPNEVQAVRTELLKARLSNRYQ